MNQGRLYLKPTRKVTYGMTLVGTGRYHLYFRARRIFNQSGFSSHTHRQNQARSDQQWIFSVSLSAAQNTNGDSPIQNIVWGADKSDEY
jgi:hypothetical protein